MPPTSDAPSPDPVEQFLAATSVGELADLRAAIGPSDDDTVASVQYPIDNWDDEQAVSNVLMYPDLLAPATRVPTLIRGLEDLGYVQVAAAVGSARIPTPVGEEDRVALVDALLDLMAGQVGLAAALSAFALGGVARSTDATEIVVLLGHPDDDVRHALQLTLIELLGPRGLGELLDDRDQVREEDAEVAREDLAADGVDLAAYEPPPLTEPAFVPDYRDFGDE